MTSVGNGTGIGVQTVESYSGSEVDANEVVEWLNAHAA